ncbi:MAG: hypothetical protein MUP16_11085 [Sedimentisphaerales bacterium]|nr:hypothetical protein [Sedimentisphaerales bacterium]
MFKVNDYKIVFKRQWHDKRRPISAELRESKLVQMPEGDGRYDTVCEIYVPDCEVPRFIGVAKLHPNDHVDRIVGKKIALRNALGIKIIGEDGNRGYSYRCVDFWRPDVRTAIWIAFRVWVESWNKKPNNIATK